jgi:hypothetical protein
MSVLLIFCGTMACSKKAEEGEGEGEFAAAATEFEGTVRTAYGPYLYLPEAQGFDIALQGFDAETLIDKEIKVTGEMLLDKPSIFAAETVEVKDEMGAYSNVYTKTGDLALEDFVSTASREAFPALNISGVNNPEEWEGKGQAKVYGKLQAETVTEEGEETEVLRIVIHDTDGREIARIIVDSFSDYARYYQKKLRLFEDYWFYLNIKDTIERRARTRTKNIFNADIVFAGLF